MNFTKEPYEKSFSKLNYGDKKKSIITPDYFIGEKILILLKKVEIVFEKINFSNCFLDINFHHKNFYYIFNKIKEKVFKIIKLAKFYKEIFFKMGLKFLNIKKIILMSNQNILMVKNFLEDLLLLNMKPIRSKADENLFKSELENQSVIVKKYIEKYKLDKQTTKFQNIFEINLMKKFPEKVVSLMKKKINLIFLKLQNYKLLKFFCKELKIKISRIFEDLSIKCLSREFENNFFYRDIGSEISKKELFEYIKQTNLFLKNIRTLLKINRSKKDSKMVDENDLKSIGRSVKIAKLDLSFRKEYEGLFTKSMYLNFSNSARFLCKKLGIYLNENNFYIFKERYYDLNKEKQFLWKKSWIKTVKNNHKDQYINVSGKNKLLNKKEKNMTKLIKSLLNQNNFLNKSLRKKIKYECILFNKFEEIKSMETDFNTLLFSTLDKKKTI